jgi:hypothetical protein
MTSEADLGLGGSEDHGTVLLGSNTISRHDHLRAWRGDLVLLVQWVPQCWYDQR